MDSEPTVTDLLTQFMRDRQDAYRIRHFMERIPSSRCMGYRRTHRFRSAKTRSPLDPKNEKHRSERCWWCKKTFGEVYDEQAEAKKQGRPPSKDTFIWWLDSVFKLNKIIKVDDYWRFLNHVEPFTTHATPSTKYGRWMMKYYPNDSNEIWSWIEEYAAHQNVKIIPYRAYRGGLGFIEFRSEE